MDPGLTGRPDPTSVSTDRRTAHDLPMGLFSFLRRQPDPAPRKRKTPSAAPLDPSAVESARVRARRRLIGAAVLVLLAVIGFPILFETAPRPVPADLPIVVAGREATPAPVLPRPPVPSVTSQTAPAAPAGAVIAAPVIEERAEEGGRDVTPPTRATQAAASASPPASASADKAQDKPPRTAPKPVDKPTEKPADKLADKAAADRARAAEAAKAQALLEGRKPAAQAAEGGRFVVQVGAFTEADALREARQRVERLGLKTYTQEVVANGSRRTRVRVGPFPSREEADRAAAKLKAAGLGAAVLTL
jgi:DedD protein